MLTSPYLQGYRAIYIPTGGLHYSQGYGAGGGVRYKNLVSMVFFSLGGLYSITHANYMGKYFNTLQ